MNKDELTPSEGESISPGEMLERTSIALLTAIYYRNQEHTDAALNLMVRTGVDGSLIVERIHEISGILRMWIQGSGTENWEDRERLLSAWAEHAIDQIADRWREQGFLPNSKD